MFPEELVGSTVSDCVEATFIREDRVPCRSLFPFHCTNMSIQSPTTVQGQQYQYIVCKEEESTNKELAALFVNCLKDAVVVGARIVCPCEFTSLAFAIEFTMSGLVVGWLASVWWVSLSGDTDDDKEQTNGMEGITWLAVGIRETSLFNDIMIRKE